MATDPAPTSRLGPLLTAALVLAALSASGCDSGAPEAPSPQVVSAVGLRLQRTDLTGPELQRATTWAAGYAASLIAAHSELAGLRVRGIFPVFDETSPVPIGAMARMVLPTAVPSVELDLIRSKGEVPERVRSEVTQLRALDAVLEFKDAQVSFLGISPLPDDAAHPESAAQARPVDPEAHRDPGFGKEDE